MLHGVFEKHQVHHCVGIIILTEGLSKTLLELIKRLELIVFLLLKAFHELGEHKRLGVSSLEILGQIVLSE